jgi:D-alanine-D-alanine ligase
MRVLVLHSDVPPDAPPDDQDTLLQAAAIELALRELGHESSTAVFAPDPAVLEALIARECPDLVFNLVETVWGRGLYGDLAPAMLSQLGVPFTGCGAAGLPPAATSCCRSASSPVRNCRRPLGPSPPHWRGIAAGRWIVKSVSEDASLGLDDGAVVVGRKAIAARAQASAARHGGRWFAERYIDGREFNVALIERHSAPIALPIGEMTFEDWDKSRPRIVGYAAKWDETAPEYRDTTRVFGWHEHEPHLRETLEHLSKECWKLFGLSGYARVDFRVDRGGRPFILEINPQSVSRAERRRRQRLRTGGPELCLPHR